MNRYATQTLAGTLATLTITSGGMLIGWASPSMSKLLASDSDLPLTSAQSAWAVSFNNFGSIFGPVVMMLVVDHIGRKSTLILGVIPMLICWLLIGLTISYKWLYVARFVGGLGLGIVCATAPMYMGEIAEDRIRGGMGALMYPAFNIGLVISFMIGPWLSRQMLALASAMPPMIFLITSFWVPETPYYYLMKGKRDKASSSLQWLRSRSNVEDELAKMEYSVRLQQQTRKNLLRLITKPGNRRAFLIAFGLITFQQFSGAMAIISFARSICAQSGSSFSSDVSAIIMSVVKLITGISVVFIVDFIGRRPILMFSTIGMTLFLLLEAAFFHLQISGQDVSAFTWIPFAGLLIFAVSFTSGLGCLPYAIIGEIFSVDVKASASMMLTMYGAAGGTMVVKLYQVGADAIGVQFVFYGYAACTVISIFFIYFCVPETKGRSLQDIQDTLNRRKHFTEDLLEEPKLCMHPVS